MNHAARTRSSPTSTPPTTALSPTKPCDASSSASSTKCAAYSATACKPARTNKMLIVMQQGATEPQIEAVVERLVELGFNVHRSTGVIHTLLGGVGGRDDFDLAAFEVMEGVKEAHRIVSPYKLASRSFRPDGTVVKIGGVEIGGERVA